MTRLGMDHDLLAYTDKSFVNFKDGTYRWVDVKRYSILDANASDMAILKAVIESRQYRDHYTTPDSQSDAGTEHGPYQLARISTDSFEECGRDGGKAAMQAFTGLYDVPPSPDVEMALAESVFQPLDRASRVFTLKQLDDALHDFGWVLEEFRELVVISADRLEVIVVVAAID